MSKFWYHFWIRLDWCPVHKRELFWALGENGWCYRCDEDKGLYAGQEVDNVTGSV